MKQRAVAIVADYLSQRPKGRIVRVHEERAGDYLVAIEDVRDGRTHVVQTTEELETWLRSFEEGRCYPASYGICELCSRTHPAKDAIAGAIYGLTDGSGDSQLFTKELARVSEGLGAEFRLRTHVRGLVSEGDCVTGVVTDEGILRADNYVLSFGVQSPQIAKTVGVRLPIYPAKGYSVTFPIGEGNEAPTIGGVDEGTLVAWSRLGDSLRFTSTAEFAGYARSWEPKDFSNILRMARVLFPSAADYSQGHYRACLRPMTPDGPAIIGRGPHTNLYYNTGHGHMGWTMACGSSRAIVDIMTDKQPHIDISGHRFRY